MHSDEPWSRPGDYVLLRALTDLVCVSSACPDDTSPANGWNPSDIHVRTYSGKETFQRTVAYRPTPDSEPRMTKQTGFHDRFDRFTDNFIEYNGFWLANCMATEGPIQEYHACREKAVVLDLSPLRKFEITGPDAEALCQYIFTRNMKTLPVGGVVYSAMCYEHGGMIDDGTVFRLGKDNFRWIGGSDYGGEWIREQAEKLGLKVLVRSSTDMQHNIAVQGPESRDILGKVIWSAPHQPDFDDLAWFRFTPARIKTHDGIPIVVSRTGYTGELGYEIFCHPKHAGAVFDAVWEAGEGHGLAPMGLEALDMVRIEAGLIFAGYDFSDQTDPYEAGIGFTVPLKSKPDDFIGRDALIREDGAILRLILLAHVGNQRIPHVGHRSRTSGHERVPDGLVTETHLVAVVVGAIVEVPECALDGHLVVLAPAAAARRLDAVREGGILGVLVEEVPHIRDAERAAASLALERDAKVGRPGFAPGQANPILLADALGQVLVRSVRTARVSVQTERLGDVVPVLMMQDIPIVSVFEEDEQAPTGHGVVGGRIGPCKLDGERRESKARNGHSKAKPINQHVL